MSSNTNDDDDFGDFEEAQINEEVISENTSAKNSDIATEQLPDDVAFVEPVQLYLLSDLLDDNALWGIEESAASIQTQSDDETIFDLFSSFDCKLTDSLMPENAKEAVELWQLLRVVEETNALKFRWNSCQLYSRFIKALDFYGSQKFNSNSRFGISKTGFLSSEEFAVNSPTSDSLGNELSLTSCLSEPITNRTQWNNALDCDFFQSNAQDNGSSVLEKELDALGLSGLSESPATNAVECSKKKIPNGTSHNQSKNLNLTALRYLSVTELSDEAQSFYERMPNLNFMLVDRVFMQEH